MKKLITLLILTFALQSCENEKKKSRENDNIQLEEKEKTKTKIDSSYKDNEINHTLENNKYQTENENLIFSFQTKNAKFLTICIDKDEKYIVYRYGTYEKIEMEFPESKNKNSFEKFEYSGWERHGGIQNEGMRLDYLTFSINNYKYIIYDTYYAVGDESNVGIKILNSETNQTTNIKGIYRTIKGSLSSFRFNDKIRKGDELYD